MSPRGFLQDALHAFLVCARLPLLFHQRRIDEFLVPGPQEKLFTILVDGRGNYSLRWATQTDLLFHDGLALDIRGRHAERVNGVAPANL